MAPDAPEGPVEIVLTATDVAGSNITASRAFTLTVEPPVEIAPLLVAEIGDDTIAEDAEFLLDVSANFAPTLDDQSAPGGDDIVLTATLEDGSELPAWLAFDPVTGIFSGTPLQEDIGELSVTVTATDDDGSVSDTFLITTENTNDAPVAVAPSPIAPVPATIDAEFAFDVPTADVLFTDKDLLLPETCLLYTSPSPRDS